MSLTDKEKETPKGYESYKRIDIPVERVVVLSTTQAALLRPLGLLDSIVGVKEEEELWYIDEVKQGLESGKIEVVGSGYVMWQVDYEKILALEPDLVFASTGSKEGLEVLHKLEELGIPCAVDNSSALEDHPLARVEWVKFLAAFYNKEDKANVFFNQVVSRVNRVASKTARVKTKPKVVEGYFYKGKVYVSRGDSYKVKMYEMAGGDYVFKYLQGTGAAFITLEEYYARAKDADIYIQTIVTPKYGVNSIETLICKVGDVIGDIKPIKENKVWIGANWYWQSIDKIDEQIEDLAAIFHPELYPGYKLKHHLKLPEK